MLILLCCEEFEGWNKDKENVCILILVFKIIYVVKYSKYKI